MKFSELSTFLEKLEKTSSRNEITEILSQLFRKTSAQEIDKVTYLLSGQLAPNYQGIVFNLAERMMIKIISQAYNVPQDRVSRAFKQRGDLGTVAQSFAQGKGKGLDVAAVYKKLYEIAVDSGKDSQERKISATAKLLAEVDPLSARYIARIPVGNLRLGFSDMTILDALSVMMVGDKSVRPQIEAAFNVSVDIGKIVKAVKEKGLSGAKNISSEPGTPVRPSLADRLPSAEKILEKVGNKVAVEPKYDGFRVQVHIYSEKGKRKVSFYSRNLENTTAMFPDLVKAVLKIKVDSAIFDAEAIGYDPKTGKFLPFQETVQRKRKHDIEEMAKKLPLKLFVFDVLYQNGKNYLKTPFVERRKILEKTLAGINGKLELTRQEIVDSPQVLRTLQKQYLAEGLEGALIKKIDSPYKAGARGFHWVKYKKTTEGGINDTIDCLVMGLNKGKGKRVGFGVGAFLVGVRDGDKFKTVSKVGTGLTDEQWRELKKRTSTLSVSAKPKNFEADKNLEPDIWVKPSLVVEILADEITKSPIHKAGLALRFPRLVRFRDEKGPIDVTSLKELEGLFKMQKA
jgi:DNA ligase-1